MEIVIKISEERFRDIQRIAEVQFESNYFQTAEQIIANGKPLPKGHGRLIDADAFGKELHRYTEAPYQYALKVFNDAPTIIEADKESEE